MTHEWIKKAILLYFPIQEMQTIEAGPFEFHDKIPLKKGFAEKGVRVVPQALARYGSFIESGAILMPSYVNIGARVALCGLISEYNAEDPPPGPRALVGVPR